MYPLLILAFACALWGLALGVRRQRRLGWVVYAASGSILAYAHALGPLYVGVLVVVFALLARDVRGWNPWPPFIVASGVIVLAYLPWLPNSLTRVGWAATDFWIEPADPEPPFFKTLHHFTVATIPSLFDLLESRIGLTVGRRPLGRWVWFAPILLALLAILLRAEGKDPRTTRPLLVAYVLPIAFLTSVSLILRPMLIPRVLLPTLVPVVLLLGAGVDFLSARRRWNHAALAVIAGILLLGTIELYGIPAREEWRELSRYLAEHVEAADLLLYDVDSWPVPSYLVERYDPSGRLRSVPRLHVAHILETCRTDVAACLTRAVGSYPSGQVVWVVHSHDQYIRVHEQVSRWLGTHLDPLSRWEFAGIVLDKERLRGAAD